MPLGDKTKGAIDPEVVFSNNKDEWDDKHFSQFHKLAPERGKDWARMVLEEAGFSEDIIETMLKNIFKETREKIEKRVKDI